MKNTIEESIHQATTSDADKWETSKVCLQNLIDLFSNGEDECTDTSQEHRQEVVEATTEGGTTEWAYCDYVICDTQYLR